MDIQIGSSSIVLKDLIEAVLEGPEGGSSASFIVWEIRLPMTFTCLFVGASLSLAGLLIQTITNNPLASPYTLGVTAGASFGAAIAITTGFALFGQIWLGVSLAALVMALTVSAFIFYLGSKRSLTATTLILVGVIMNFFFQALQQYLQLPSFSPKSRKLSPAGHSAIFRDLLGSAPAFPRRAGRSYF